MGQEANRDPQAGGVRAASRGPEACVRRANDTDPDRMDGNHMVLGS